MNTYWMTCISLATLVPTFALAEKLSQAPLPLPKFEIQGAPLRTGVTLLTPVISAEIG